MRSKPWKSTLRLSWPLLVNRFLEHTIWKTSITSVSPSRRHWPSTGRNYQILPLTPSNCVMTPIFGPTRQRPSKL